MRGDGRLRGLLTGAVLAAISVPASAAGPYFVAKGRWDNTIIVIDFAKAIDPKNDGTPNAIVNRLRVTPDIDAKGTGRADTPAGGQPVNIVIAPDKRRAYVVNHSGRVTQETARAFQHGHPGTVTVVDLTIALDPANNGTLNAVGGYIETEGAGPVGFAITPDQKHAALSHAEQYGDEDGGREIMLIALATRKVVRKVFQSYGKPGFPCPPNPVPHAAPHPSFGCFPDANGVTISPLQGGLIFTGNGGTDDVSVISLPRALAGDPRAEIARIPVQTGPFGVSTSPDGRLVVVANRESARADAEGNTISLIDVEKAASDPTKAEVARILVGTNNPATRTRPFAAAFTADGQRIVATISAPTKSQSLTSGRCSSTSRPRSRASRSPPRAERRRGRAALPSRRMVSMRPSLGRRAAMRTAAWFGSSTSIPTRWLGASPRSAMSRT